MSYINLDGMSYVQYITQSFLYFKDSGTQLSALELDLIYEWQDHQIPEEVICRTFQSVQQACRDEEQKFPRSLLYFKKPVNDSVASLLAKNVGYAPE